MIIIPDLFSPYVEGVETARKANWDDLNNYNKVQKGQLDNLFGLATFSPKVNAEYEKTDKAALENLFNEENFQNKLLDEILNTQLRQAQIANTQRMAQGIGLRGGRAAAPGVAPATPDGTATQPNAAPAPGLDPNLGATPQPVTTPAASPLQQARAELQKRGITAPTASEYQVSRSNRGGVMAPDYSLGVNLTPFAVNTTGLSGLATYGYRTPEEIDAWRQNRQTMLAHGVQLDDDSLYGTGRLDYSGYNRAQLEGLGVTEDTIRNLKDGQAVSLQGNKLLYNDKNNLFITPYDPRSGMSTFRVPAAWN